MALQTLASNITSDGVTPTVDVTNPCSIFISGVMGDAEVTVEVSPNGTGYSVAGRTAGLDIEPPVVLCDVRGDYKVRVRVHKASSSTNLTFRVNQ